MKKILIAISLIVFLIPFPVFSLETLSSDDMEKTVGQAGVNISVDETVNMDVTMNPSSLKVGDSDLKANIISGQDPMNVKIYRQTNNPLALNINSDNGKTSLDVTLSQLNMRVANLPDVNIANGNKTLASIDPGDMTFNVNSGHLNLKLGSNQDTYTVGGHQFKPDLALGIKDLNMDMSLDTTIFSLADKNGNTDNGLAMVVHGLPQTESTGYRGTVDATTGEFKSLTYHAKMNVSQRTGDRPMLINTSVENNQTALCVALPQIDISVTNIPSYIGFYADQQCLGELNVSGVQMRVNSGALKIKMLK